MKIFFWLLKNMCIFIFCLYKVWWLVRRGWRGGLPQFPLKFPHTQKFLRKIKVSQRPRERRGFWGGIWGGFPIRCCLYGFNGFPHTHYNTHTHIEGNNTPLKSSCPRTKFSFTFFLFFTPKIKQETKKNWFI